MRGNPEMDSPVMVYGLFVFVHASLRSDLDRKSEQIDESRTVLLIVNVIFVEGCDLFAVERIRRNHPRGYHVALVEFERDISGYVFLRFINECGERLAQGSEPLTEVYELGKL